jgi:hypothetical protein
MGRFLREALPGFFLSLPSCQTRQSRHHLGDASISRPHQDRALPPTSSIKQADPVRHGERRPDLSPTSGRGINLAARDFAVISIDIWTTPRV